MVAASWGRRATWLPSRSSTPRSRWIPGFDVFALGSILCQVLTGWPAYGWDTPLGAARKELPPDPSRALARLGTCGADDELVGLVRECLDRDPSGRPADAGAMAARLTAYLDGVSERLRVAELARVEAQARAVEERKRRRLTGLLAVLAAALVALAAGGYADRLRRRQAGQAAADRVLREAEVLRDQAADDPTGDPANWRAAGDALRRAQPLLDGASAATEGRLTVLATELERGFNSASSDRRLLEDLEFARYRADEGELRVADDRIESAFGEIGMDVSASAPAAIGAAPASRPSEVREALVAALDGWAIVRREQRGERSRGRRPVAGPPGGGPSRRSRPLRSSLRDALEKKDREALGRLARTEANAGRPAPSLWLMGRLLIWTGQVELAGAFLKDAWRSHPHDFWINLELSRALMLQPWDPDHALVYATTAVSLRPDSAVAHLRLGYINQVFADKVAAEAEYRAALRLWPDYGRATARLAGLLFFRSRRAEAAEEYRTAIRLMPDEAEPLRVGLGDSLMRLHRLEDAAVELEDAARRHPSSAPVWIQLARLRLARRNASGAAEAIDRARSLVKPGSPGAEQVAREQMRLELLRRLPALLRGEERPRDNVERLELAKLCGEAGLAAVGRDSTPRPSRPIPPSSRTA